MTRQERPGPSVFPGTSSGPQQLQFRAVERGADIPRWLGPGWDITVSATEENFLYGQGARHRRG